MGLHIATRIERPKGKIVLIGRFDFDSHRRIRDAWREVSTEDGLTEVEIDFSGVGEVDEGALGVLLLVKEEAYKSHLKLVLTNCPPTIESIMDSTDWAKLPMTR